LEVRLSIPDFEAFADRAGGMPFTPNLYGLAADSVENFKVSSINSVEFSEANRAQCVLANSTIINANAASHPDLFTALKGGGANFGTWSISAVRMSITK
jgi:hypothetical protein